MSNMSFAVKITAVGEVRDKDGNLVTTFPVEMDRTMTAEDVAALTEGEQS